MVKILSVFLCLKKLDIISEKSVFVKNKIIDIM